MLLSLDICEGNTVGIVESFSVDRCSLAEIVTRAKGGINYLRTIMHCFTYETMQHISVTYTDQPKVHLHLITESRNASYKYITQYKTLILLDIAFDDIS